MRYFEYLYIASMRSIKDAKKYSYDNFLQEHIKHAVSQPLRLAYYQRSYKWDSEQVDDCFSDLINAYISGSTAYFMGSLVISERQKKEGIKSGESIYDLVDGQQRIITLSLLLLAIYKFYHHKTGESSPVPFQGFVSAENEDLSFYSVMPNGLPEINDDTLEKVINKSSQYLLINESFYQDAFKKLLIEDVENIFKASADQLSDIGKGQGNASKGRMWDNCRSFLIHLRDDKRVNTENLPQFAAWIKNAVTFAGITVGEPEEAYEVFEVLNDRGRTLTQAEKLKGFLLSRVNSDDRNSYKDKWEEIYDKLTSVDYFHKYVKGEIDKSKNSMTVMLEREEDFFWESFLTAYLFSHLKHVSARRSFERKGFYKWVKSNWNAFNDETSLEEIKLLITKAYESIDNYITIRKASVEYSSQYEKIYLFSQGDKALPKPFQAYPLLASVMNENIIDRKIAKLQIMAWFLDNINARATFSGTTKPQNPTLGNPIIDALVAITDKDSAKAPIAVEDLQQILEKYIARTQATGFIQEDAEGKAEEEYPGNFQNLGSFSYKGQGKIISVLFKRLSIFLDQKIYGSVLFNYFDMDSKIDMSSKKPGALDLDHIWAKNLSRQDIVGDLSEYQQNAYSIVSDETFGTDIDSIGDLTLLEANLNNKFSNKVFSERDYTLSKVILSRLLNKLDDADSDDFMIKNYLDSIAASGIVKETNSGEGFAKQDMKLRIDFYKKLASELWYPVYREN